jgi:calcineurin-like phosphoesterase
MDFGTENPFIEAEKILTQIDTKVTLVDFHAEATSEKMAMAFHLDGRVSAVWGTHTHVQTSDACVFPNGTGYITDLGMTGPQALSSASVPSSLSRVFSAIHPSATNRHPENRKLRALFLCLTSGPAAASASSRSAFFNERT